MLQMRKHRQKTKIKKKRKKERNKNNQSINQLAQGMLLSKGISPIVILPFYSFLV
jgi:F0F1-type ATP synthase assembly protein I